MTKQLSPRMNGRTGREVTCVVLFGVHQSNRPTSGGPGKVRLIFGPQACRIMVMNIYHQVIKPQNECWQNWAAKVTCVVGSLKTGVAAYAKIFDRKTLSWTTSSQLSDWFESNRRMGINWYKYEVLPSFAMASSPS